MHRCRTWPLLAVALAACLAGCEGTSISGLETLTGTSTSSPGRFIDKVAKRQDPLPPQEPPPENAVQSRRDAAAASTVADSVRLKRVHSAGVTELPAVEEYLNGILRRLADGWPGQPVAARVFVTPGNTLNAEALPGGGIFVTVGMLDVLESEDEIAFLLGHELSHVLLAHHRRGKLQEFAQQASSVVNVGLSFASDLGKASTDNKERLQRASLINYLANTAGQVVLLPAWGRQQEEEADMLGLDLMLAAGFNEYGATRVFQILEEDEQQRTRQRQEEVDLAQQKLTGPSPGESLTFAFAQMKRDFGQFVDSLRAGHEDAASRLNTLNEYLEREYADRPFSNLSTAQWLNVWSQNAVQRQVRGLMQADVVAAYLAAQHEKEALAAGTEALNLAPDNAYVRLQMSYLRAAQGRRKDALTNLQRGMSDPGRPLRLYVALANAYLADRRVSDAQSVLVSAEREFGNTPVLLVPQIEVQRATGNQQQMNMLLLRCQVEGAPDVYAQCRTAAGQKEEKNPLDAILPR